MGNGHRQNKNVIKFCKKSPDFVSKPSDVESVEGSVGVGIACLPSVATSLPAKSQPSENVGSSDLLTVLEVVGISSLLVDEFGTVLGGNSEFEELSGQAVDSLRGMPVKDLLNSISTGDPEWFEQSDRSRCRCTRQIKGRECGQSDTVTVSCVRFGPSDNLSNITLCMIRRQFCPQRIQETLQVVTRRWHDCQAELQRKSVAIYEMLSALEVEKKRIQADVRANIEQIVMPIVHHLKRQASDEQLSYLEGLEETVKDITSPFVQTLSAASPNLTPREIEICSLIRQGMSSKQMAVHLCTSEETVRAQRKSIRRKLGISNKKNVSLRLALENL